MMKNSKKIIYILAAIALITVTVIQLMSNKKKTLDRVFHSNKEQAVRVQSVKISPESIENESSYTGIFEPNKETKVSADIQGKINAVLVDAGSIVSKGQPLIHLDNSLLKLQVQSVENQIEGLESDVRRYTVLAKADAIQGVQLEKAELGLRSAQIQKATLLEQINKTTIKAPFSGIVTAKLTEAGAFAAPGVPLLQITDISLLKFTIQVPEHDLDRFKTGEPYDVIADVYPGKILSGHLTLTGSKANKGNSFPVQFSVSNTPDQLIRSGMFGKVILSHDSEEKVLIIPSSSVVGTNIKPQVYKVNQNKAILQDITISERFADKIVVSDGLADGDIIITGGFVNLFNGANVILN